MVEVEVRDGVARVLLSRPEKANALSSPMLAKLRAAIESLEGDGSVRVAVLAGRGKAFCGGADVEEMARLDASNAAAFVESIHFVCRAIRALEVPVVAQLHAAVIGAGLEIAAACDLRVAAEGTRFSMPEVRLGIPSVVEAALLPRLVGSGRAAWLVLTGEAIDARRALEWGLIEEIGGADAVERVVAALRAGEPRALAAQKRLLQAWEEAPLAQSVTQSLRAFAQAFEHGNTIGSRQKGKKH